MNSVDTRRCRTRSIGINRVEDTPKTVHINTFLKKLLADRAGARMADTVLITALTSPKDIHCCAIKKFDITQLLDNVDFGVNGIVGVSGSERTRTELIHCGCQNAISLT